MSIRNCNSAYRLRYWNDPKILAYMCEKIEVELQ